MNKDTKNLIEFLVILLFGAYNLYLYFSGGLANYIHPRYNLLSLVTASLCIFFSLLGVISTIKKNTHKSHINRVSLHYSEIVLVIVALYGLIVPPSTLSSLTAVKRSSNAPTQRQESMLIDNALFSSFDYSTLNIADWTRLLENNPAAFADKEIKIIGFVYRGPDDTGTFYRVARFVISCCAVDATPMSLIVKGSLPLELSDNDWIEFTGKIQVSSSNPAKTFLLPIDVKKIDQPANPYVY